VLFQIDPFSPQLRTHKLHGDFEGFWAFSVDYKNRVIFEFQGDDLVLFYAIGGHEIYD
jgi:mRNA-degrading endonuclease YafQ of YafQ-DinJ toxin-antitoxin module